MASLPQLVETDRLVLRGWSSDDLAPLGSVFAEPRVWRFPSGRGWSLEETAAFLTRQRLLWEERGLGLWAAELRATGELIGYVGLSVPTFLPEVLPAVEVGWRLHPDHWGRGLATEGGREAVRQGFSALDLEAVISIAQPENQRSIEVMRRLGMRESRRTVHPDLGVPLVVHVLERPASPAGSEAGTGQNVPQLRRSAAWTEVALKLTCAMSRILRPRWCRGSRASGAARTSCLRVPVPSSASPTAARRLPRSGGTVSWASLEFQRSLPAKRMGSGLLIRDTSGNVLLVEPTYKQQWEVPGGAVEADESPAECASREVQEELGIEVVPGRLLVVEYQHPEPGRTESMMFIFDGGVAGPERTDAIVLQAAELEDWRFVAPDELGDLTSPRMARRLRHALAALSVDQVRYLEDGRPWAADEGR